MHTESTLWEAVVGLAVHDVVFSARTSTTSHTWWHDLQTAPLDLHAPPTAFVASEAYARRLAWLRNAEREVRAR